uniref:Transcriptional regulator n=1 Tax=Desulfovibrio sp. U5L TaxID=596152 RepID=I2PWZ7_9BACT
MPAILPENIGINLSRTGRLMRTRLDERLVPLGLTQAKWLILLYLSRNGGIMPQKDIADCVGVEGPTVVRVLDGLERMGLIERREQPADRRTKDVCLTPQASTVLEEIATVTERFRQEMWTGVSDEDLAAYERVIAILQRNLNASSRRRG